MKDPYPSATGGAAVSLYFIKPVVWNSLGYLRPSGAKFGSGYPAETGFGHEEWNNSPRLTFVDRSQKKHAFHTEGFGNQPLDEAAGDIYVFMIASHQRKQFLVAVAGQSTSFFKNRKERERLFGMIKERSILAEEAWKVAAVRRAHSNRYAKLLTRWKKEQHWFVSWTCPADHYLGLTNPIELNASEITGRRRLVGMYGAYQEIDRLQAVRMLDRIPEDQDQEALANIRSACGQSNVDVITDIRGINAKSGLQPTTRRALIDARLGQGQFRKDLEELWSDKCAVTRCSVTELLRASHIKPWRYSSDKERLDPKNGILLTAHLDALFDSGLITFNDAGVVICSTRLVDDGKPKLYLATRIATSFAEETKSYLGYHRKHVFRP